MTDYEITKPFDDDLNERLNRAARSVGQPYAEPGHEMLPLPEDTMEARLEQARREEREACAKIAESVLESTCIPEESGWIPQVIERIRARGEAHGEE